VNQIGIPGNQIVYYNQSSCDTSFEPFGVPQNVFFDDLGMSVADGECLAHGPGLWKRLVRILPGAGQQQQEAKGETSDATNVAGIVSGALVALAGLFL
jgi:hypothetical protein